MRERFAMDPIAALQAELRSVGRRPFSTGHIAIASMVRDELEMLPAFLNHHMGLADSLYFADHLSTDGTREYLHRVADRISSDRMLTVLHHDADAYMQGDVSRALMRSAFADGADWVIVIDADEFLHYEQPDELRAALAASATPVAYFDWVNLVPRLTGTDAADPDRFDPAAPLQQLAADLPARSGKYAVHRSFVERFPAFALQAHQVRVAENGLWTRGTTVGQLLHVPARTVAQVARKRTNLSLGFSADTSVTANPQPHLSEERDRARALTRAELTADDAARFLEQVAIRYDNKVMRTRPRGEWVRREQILPSRARDSERSVYAAIRDDVRSEGLLSSSIGRAPAGSSTAPAVVGPRPRRRSTYFEATVIDGRLDFRPSRRAALRSAWWRLRASVAVQSLPVAVVRPVALFFWMRVIRPLRARVAGRGAS